MMQFFLPEITQIIAIIVTLIVGLVTPKAAIFQRISALTLFIFGLILVELLFLPTQSFTIQGWQNDLLSQNMKILVMGLLLFSAAISRHYVASRRVRAFEYYLLLQVVSLGMMVTCSASHYLILFLGLELMALPLYALIALFNGRQQVEAAIKYFILGALATGIMLFGISLLFGLTGSMDFQLPPMGTTSTVAILFLVAGLLFKLGCAPFHTWVPDVYQGTSLPTLSIIATAPKVAYLTVLIRLADHGLMTPPIAALLSICGLLSIALGNFTALKQTNFKRLMGYSSVAHMGFLVLALLVSQDGWQAAIFYVLIYTLSTLAALGVVTLLSDANTEFEELSAFKALASTSPWMALLLMGALFSMAGVPPLGGFMTKFTVLFALLNHHHITIALAVMLFSVVGVFYYIRVIKNMYFETSENSASAQPTILGQIVVSVPVILVVLIGVLPNIGIQWSAKLLQNPTHPTVQLKDTFSV